MVVYWSAYSPSIPKIRVTYNPAEVFSFFLLKFVSEKDEITEKRPIKANRFWSIKTRYFSPIKQDINWNENA